MLKRLRQILRAKPVIISLAVVVLLTIAIVVGSVVLVSRYVAVGTGLQQSYDYSLRLEQLLSEVRNAGINQRQYLITGDLTYANGYNESVKKINSQLAAIKPLLESKQYEKISRLVKVRLTTLSKASDILRSGDRQAAIDSTANIESLRLTSQLTAQISSLEKQKKQQIDQQRAATSRLSNLVLFAIAGCALISCVLIGFVLHLVFDLEKKEKSLRRSQGELQSIVDHAPNYIQMLDLDLKRVFISRSAEGTTTEPLLGKVFGDFMDKSEKRRVHRILRQVIKTSRSTDFEFVTHLDGGEQWYKNSVGPIYTGNIITGLVLITFDTSREKQALRSLEKQKEAAEEAQVQSEALLKSIGEGLLVIDEHGVIANANAAATTALGYKANALVGKWFPGTVLALDAQGNAVHPLNRPATQALMSGRVISDTITYQRKDGSTFPVALTVSPVIIKGKPVGAIEVFRDLTNERELEHAKEQFVSLASHQLRTPATGAKAFISVLLDGYAGKLTERQREYIEKIQKTNERQLEIINDMLNVARIDSGRIMPEIVSTNIAQLLREIVEEQRPMATERQQRLELILPSKTPSILCDPKLMHMALDNILNNASKYTYKGGDISVSLRFSASLAHIRVEDTGVGIDIKDQTKIFHRFARVYNPLSIARGGTGLGLYLTRNIIDLHHGLISIDSSPGAGTIFDIDLPIQPLPSAATSSTQNTNAPLRSET